MYSVGIDLIEIVRISQTMKRQSFLKRILGADEYVQLEKRGFPVQSVAVNFCAKEAFLKAFGKGLGDIRLPEIELLRGDKGQPYLKLKGKAAELTEGGKIKFSVSATHTKEYASVIILAYDE